MHLTISILYTRNKVPEIINPDQCSIWC